MNLHPDSPILRARPAIDLRYRAWTRVLHGIRIIGTWLNDGEVRSQPAMVLMHATRPINAMTIPVIIPLESAWVWAAHNDVGDPAHCRVRIEQWLSEGLLPGNASNASDRIDVLDAINNCLPDLIAMPPRPRLEHDIHIGTMTVTNHTTGTTSEQEVSTNV